MIGIARPDAEPALAQELGVEITYFESFDETIFMTNEDVCVVPVDMMDAVVDGKLKMTAVDHIMNDECGTADREFTVVGAYAGGSGAVYCPWETVCGIIEEVGGNIYTESLSFTIEDNYRLEEFKQKAAQYFASANLSPGETIYSFALTVYDGVLIESTTAVRGEIWLLEILIPVLLILSAGIGFVAAFLYIRNRKQEFAVMRSLGTGKRQVFMASFFEQVILVTAGTVLGMCSYILIRGISVAPNYTNLLIYLLCYLLRAAVAVVRITRINVMEIMRINE